MTTIEELESRCSASNSITPAAKSIGTFPKRKTALDLSDLKRGDILREKETGCLWQYLWPAERAGCVRVVTTGGAASMDMSLTRLEKSPQSQITAPEAYFYPPVTRFSVARGDDPNDPKFRSLIRHVMEVRNRLDQDPKTVYKADPDSNLRATAARKTEARKSKST